MANPWALLIKFAVIIYAPQYNFWVVTMSQNYSNLSKEELIAALLRADNQLSKTEAKLNKAEFKLSKTEAKLNKAELKLNKTELKLSKTEDKLKEALAHQEALATIAQNFIKNAKATIQQINSQWFLYNQDAFTLDIQAAFKRLFDDCMKCVNHYKSAYLASSFSNKGNDVNSGSASSKNKPNIQSGISDLEEQVKNIGGSLKNNTKHFNRIKLIIIDLYERCQKEGLTEEAARLEKLIKVLKIQARHTNKNKDNQLSKKKGRQATKNFDNKTKECSKATLTKDQCSCADSQLVEVSELVENIISQCNDVREIIQAVPKGHKVYLCENCGNCKIAFDPEKDDFPVAPNRNIGMSIMRASCRMLYSGMPLHRYIETFAPIFNLGHDTIPRNLRDYVDYYIDPIYQLIYQQAKELDILVVDETIYDCLQHQGKGNMSQETRSLKDKGELKTNSKNYILAISSVPQSKTPLVLYHYINNRNTDNIANIINETFKFKFLVSDAFPAYLNICEQVEGRVWQTCLIHLRREIVKACNPKSYAQDLEALSNNELFAKMLLDFSDNSPAAVMLSVFFAISKIYEIEGSLSLNISENKDSLYQKKLENREQIRALLEYIDERINSIKDDYVEQVSTGKYKSKKRGSPYVKPIVYYLNHKENFKTFLDNPDVPPDSNSVEGLIRKITIVRSAMKHKVNPDDMQDFCKIMTVYKTLELAGHDPETYLQALNNHMFAHAVSKRLRTYFETEGQPLSTDNHQIKIKDFNMKELLSDFDLSKFPIFNK